jgi:hypothetical protein
MLEQAADLKAGAKAGRGSAACEGHFEGQIALRDADPGLSPLACASVFPDQWLYQERSDRSAIHSKEKVYGSIP